MPDQRGVLPLSAPPPPVVVLDTSAVICALLEDQAQHDEYAGFLERAVAAGTMLVYCDLLDFELADVSMTIALKRRHGRAWFRHRGEESSLAAARVLMHEVFARWRETMAQTSSARLPLGPFGDQGNGSPVRDRAFTLLEAYPIRSYDAAHAAKAVIDSLVARLNGLGKLRWGRAFAGVDVASIESTDGAGTRTTHVFPPPARAHLTHDQFVRFAVRQGLPTPPAPEGVADISALELSEVGCLAQTDPDVARALRLLDLALRGDHGLEWTMAYCALEVVEEDARNRRLDGQSLGWWRGAERERFRRTANSVEALGIRTRHGKRFDPPQRRMNDHEASWYLRRVVARWLAHRLTLQLHCRPRR